MNQKSLVYIHGHFLRSSPLEESSMSQDRTQQEYQDLKKELELVEKQLGKLNNEKRTLQKQGKKFEIEEIDKKIAPLAEKKAHLISGQKKLEKRLNK
jgi:beta-N-acetylglucosaminidase